MNNGKIDFASRRKTVTVDVPELETSIRLRALTTKQLNVAMKEPDELKGARQLFLAIVDENGQPVYTTEEDFQNLAEMSLSVHQLLMETLNEMHGFTNKAVAETKKNSEPAAATIDSASA